MKQRLLFTLLMLFVSVGFMKANITLTVPKGKTVTITGKVRQPNTTPKILIDSKEVQDFSRVNDGTYTVKSAETEQEVILTNGFTSVTISSGEVSKLVIYDHNIVNLTASNLKLTELSITAAGALKELNVSTNELTTMDLTEAKALEVLNAANNKLIGLAGTVPTTLKTINLANNEYTSLSFAALAKLESLDLTNNKLTSLTVPAATTAKEFKTLKVDGNSLMVINDAPEGTVWGTQTKEVEVSCKANDRFDILGVCVNNSILFNLGTVDKLKENKSKLSYIWNKQVNNVYQTTASDEVHTLFATTNPELFVFGKVTGNELEYINAESIYQCVINYDNKMKVVVKGIKVSPAELTLSLGDGLSAAKVGSNTALADGAKVNQGDHILFTVAKEGFTLKKFKEVAGLTAVDNAQMTKNGGEFIVTGSVNKSTGNETNPSIRADFEGGKCTVKANTTAEGGLIKLEAKYDNKTTELTAESNTIYKGSELILTLKPDLGFEPNVLINGKTYSKTNMTQKDNNYILTLSASAVTKDMEILVSFVKNTGVTVSLKLDGATALNDGHFAGSKIKIGNTDYTATGDHTLTPGKTQLSFALTKQAALGTWSKGTFKVEDIRLNTTSILSSATINTVENPAGNEYAAIEYTVPVEIPTENATITIVLKKLETVNLVPEGSNKEQKQTYDGNPKTFKFKTAPEGIKVEYKDANQANAQFTTDIPTAVGTYNVKLTCPATGSFAALDNREWKLIIEKATPAFVTVPGVTINKETGKYVIDKKGVVKLGTTALVGKYAITGGDTPSPENAKKSHIVTVEFVVNDGKSDNPNYNKATAQVAVTVGDEALASCKVDLQVPAGFTGQLLNGDKEVALKSEVAKTTKLTVKLTIPETVNASSIKLYSAKDPNRAIKNFTNGTYDGETRTLIFKDIEVVESITYVVKATAHDVKHEYKVELKKHEAVYDGKVKSFDKTNMTITGAGTSGFNENTVKQSVEITYKDKDGKAVVAPENVGLYTVCVKIPYNGNSNDYATYKEYVAEFKDYLEIKKGKVTISEWPTKSSQIAKGQTLVASELSGGNASVAGKFRWMKEDEKPVSGKKYEIYFDPDNKNYDIVKGGTEHAVEVNVSDKNLVTFVPQNCVLTVVNAETGAAFKTGDVVAKGTQLKITVQANESFVMKTFTVNGKPFTSGSVHTVGDETVEIVAIAQLKQVDPTAVVLTISSGAGAVPSKIGAHEVIFNSNLTFSVATLQADKDKVVVKVDGTVIKPNSSGVYTVKADKKKSIAVSVTNPTAITLKADTTLSPGKKPMGKVEIQGWKATNKYYYGDEITVTAFPESGASFAGWKDITSKENPMVVTLTKESYVFKALYSGALTGIEDIESVKIYGSKGCIVIKGAVDAKVTVVSMDGRLQKQQIAGDSRIEAAAGIYGVVLEQGNEVKQTKVIVR